jgi:putative flavoprotein involved in K+ transport
VLLEHLRYVKRSSQHPGGGGWTGKKAVVIGSNNSAHDICAELWEHGADVTMVQRSSTHIARSESLMDLALGDLYSEKALANGVTTKKADLLFASLPYRIPAGGAGARVSGDGPAGRRVLLAAGGCRV